MKRNGKRGRPPKAPVKKCNPSYTKIIVKTTLQSKLMDKDCGIDELVAKRNRFVEEVLAELDHKVKMKNGEEK